MEALIKLVQGEWNTLSSAPVTFILFGISAFTVAILAASWRHSGIIESLRERIENLNSRIQGKDEQLSEYRERLHLTSSEATSFGRMSNKEVKDKALGLVVNMREFLKAHDTLSNNRMISSHLGNYKEMTEEQRQGKWEESTRTMMQDSLKLNAEYDSKFKTDSLLLRDELLSRLPKDFRSEKSMMYEHPTNPLGMKSVADNLEMLAKSL